MKSRKGFVSNSSSSSFVIAVKDKNCKILIEIDDCFGLYEDETPDYSESSLTDVTKRWQDDCDEYKWKYIYRISVDYNEPDLCEDICYVFNKETGKQIETSVEGDGFKIIEGWY